MPLKGWRKPHPAPIYLACTCQDTWGISNGSDGKGWVAACWRCHLPIDVKRRRVRRRKVMLIDEDVRAIATGFAEGDAFTELVQSVVRAEGNIVRAVQCTYPHILTRQDAIRVVCRSAIHAMADYLRDSEGPTFLQFWGDRWAPTGAVNDPQGLNANWVPNVSKFWGV